MIPKQTEFIFSTWLVHIISISLFSQKFDKKIKWREREIDEILLYNFLLDEKTNHFADIVKLVVQLKVEKFKYNFLTALHQRKGKNEI